MNSSSAALLQEAVRLHERGALDEAVARYGKVLAAEPDNVDALFRLGRASCQQGRLAEGADLFRKTLAVDPDHAEAHNFLGMALDRLGRGLEALPCFDRAIAADPDSADAQANKADALSNLGRFAEAIRTYDRAIALKPDFAAAWCNRGIALHQEKRHAEAIESFTRAIAANPGLAEAHANMGKTLTQIGRLDEAIASFDKAIALRRDVAHFHADRAATLQAVRRLDEALASMDRASSLDPSSAQIHCNRATILSDLGRAEEALKCADRAVELNPSLAKAHLARGNVLNELDRYDEALVAIDRALAIDPDLAEAYVARSFVNLSLGRGAEARTDSERAVALDPGNDGRIFNLSLIQLLQGDWKEGWQNYERRGTMRRPSHGSLALPRWNGEPLNDRSLILVSEQSYGDTILSCRFAKVLADHGIRVRLMTYPGLIGLLGSLKGVEELILIKDEVERHLFKTRWLPLFSVPRILGITPDTVPAEVPYLFAEPARVAAFKARLGEHGFKIGITWQGGMRETNTRHRSFPLSEFAPIAAIPGVRLISMQRGAANEQIAGVEFRDRIERVDDGIGEGADEFLDLAGLIMNMDLVISCSTTRAHLTGALGRPLFLALPFNTSTEWRWLLEREDSPWYPTARLFRQNRVGDWRGVFERIAAAVRERAGR